MKKHIDKIVAGVCVIGFVTLCIVLVLCLPARESRRAKVTPEQSKPEVISQSIQIQELPKLIEKAEEPEKPSVLAEVVDKDEFKEVEIPQEVFVFNDEEDSPEIKKEEYNRVLRIKECCYYSRNIFNDTKELIPTIEMRKNFKKLYAYIQHTMKDDKITVKEYDNISKYLLEAAAADDKDDLDKVKEQLKKEVRGDTNGL